MKIFLVLALLLAACATSTPAAPALRAMPTTTPLPLIPPAPTPTPPPLPTLPPTPAPVAYTIQRGDTLISIATKFNVALEALDQLNPKLDPARLQPGQIILLPPDTPGVTASAAQPLPLLTPLPVAANTFFCYPTPANSVLCLSEFKNTTPTPIANLSVQVNLLNADNTPGANAIAYAPLDLIPSGVTVPLAVTFTQATLGNNRAVNSAVLTAEAAPAGADRYILLNVGAGAGTSEPTGFMVKGTLTNPLNAPVKAINVVATVYNSAGAVLSYRKLTLPNPLAAQSSTPFSLTFTGVTEAARWNILAQAQK